VLGPPGTPPLDAAAAAGRAVDGIHAVPEDHAARE
jgi:hypothetical protein